MNFEALFELDKQQSKAQKIKDSTRVVPMNQVVGK